MGLDVVFGQVFQTFDPDPRAGEPLGGQVDVVRVFHGTRTAALPAILRQGVRSNLGYDRPAWYMVAEDPGSAGDEGSKYSTGELVVLELLVPTHLKRQRKMWDGWPYLWKPAVFDRQPFPQGATGPTRWWALRRPLPASFVARVHQGGV